MASQAYSVDEHFSTAKEFVDFFSNDERFVTRNIFEAVLWGSKGYVFRGQSDHKWPLAPRVFRDDNPLAEYTPQTAGGPIGDQSSPLEYLGWHLHSELRAIFLFLETADRIGIETPIDYTNLRQHHEIVQSALNEQSDADYRAPFPNACFLDGMALAQHHGVPTRLLDWTESPYVAAYFAASGSSSVAPEHSRVQSERISVAFLYLAHLKEDHDVNLAMVNAPRYGNTFLRAQQGLFTYFPSANAYFIENRRWPSVESVVTGDSRLDGRLGRASLPSEQADEVLRSLYRLGITRASMMPVLGHAATEFQYRRALFGRS